MLPIEFENSLDRIAIGQSTWYKIKYKPPIKQRPTNVYNYIYAIHIYVHPMWGKHSRFACGEMHIPHPLLIYMIIKLNQSGISLYTVYIPICILLSKPNTNSKEVYYFF